MNSTRRGLDRRAKLRRWAPACIFLGAWTFAFAAHADAPATNQPMLMGPGPNQGDPTGGLGFKLGDNNGRLHPFIDIDTHWVTNPGRLPHNISNIPSDLENSGRIGFDLNFPSDTLELRGDAFVSYNRYWGVQTPATTGFSTFFGALNLGAVINKDGTFVLRLNEGLVRSADPSNQTFTTRLLHWVEQAGAALDIKPGGGTLLITAGCGYYLDNYDNNQAGLPINGLLNNWRILPELRFTWKFLPKTGVFIEGLGQFTRYDQNTNATNGTAPVENVDSNMVSAAVGVAGAITPRINALIKGGYANTLLVGGVDNLQTGVGAIDFTFNFSETGRLDIGALRALQPTSIFRYDVMTGAYIRYTQQVAQQTFLSAAPAFNYYTYGTALVGPSTARVDTDLVVDVSIKQGLTEWLALSLIDRVDWRMSNYVTAVGDAGYFFNDIYLRIDFRY